MSKKKSFSGSTMTLKDFHGGSIPSDLPLPSAPGVTVRPPDRSGFDRPSPNPWGSPIGRSDHRFRPGSSGASRHYDEKAAFLSHPPHVGRNFDEDERKPLDGISAPRRTISDDAISSNWTLPIRNSDPNSDVSKLQGRPLTSPVLLEKPPVAAAQLIANNVGGQAAAAPFSAPNVWAARKDVAASEPPSSWTGQNAVSKFAQASAMEKIQSGRWQSKPSVHTQVADVEIIRYSEMEGEIHSKGGNVNMHGYYGVDQAADAQGFYCARKEFQDHERATTLMSYSEQVRPVSAEGKLDICSNHQVQVQQQFFSPAPEEVIERPKLKLLPRIKPLVKPEMQAEEQNQVLQQPGASHVEIGNDMISNLNLLNIGVAGDEGGSHLAERRPKLNLKPRSQPVEALAGNAERERKALFGGARPRELVLKERGVEPAVVDDLDKNQLPPIRAKEDASKLDLKQDPTATAARYGERRESLPLDQRNLREFDRKDHRPDLQKTDLRRSSWRNDNKRNNRDFEKQQQEQRRPEPDTWRKPVEPLKPDPSDNPAPRHGRIASPLELAHAFSKPASDTKAADKISSQKNKVPFSRLTDTREFYPGPHQRQINGY